jgi:hypothetical protein
VRRKIIALCLIVSLLSACGMFDVDVLTVREGSFEDYPNTTIGEAFDNFFGSSSWRSFTADSGETIVEFTGRCTYMDEEVDALLQFEILENDRFEFVHLSLNDISQNDITKWALIEKVYEGY